MSAGQPRILGGLQFEVVGQFWWDALHVDFEILDENVIRSRHHDVLPVFMNTFRAPARVTSSTTCPPKAFW